MENIIGADSLVSVYKPQFSYKSVMLSLLDTFSFRKDYKMDVQYKQFWQMLDKQKKPGEAVMKI